MFYQIASYYIFHPYVKIKTMKCKKKISLTTNKVEKFWTLSSIILLNKIFISIVVLLNLEKVLKRFHEIANWKLKSNFFHQLNQTLKFSFLDGNQTLINYYMKVFFFFFFFEYYMKMFDFRVLGYIFLHLILFK